MKEYYSFCKFEPKTSYHIFDAAMAAMVGWKFIHKQLPEDQLKQIQSMIFGELN